MNNRVVSGAGILLVSLILACAMGMGLVACSPSTDDGATPSSDAPANEVYRSYTFTGQDALVADTDYLVGELGYNPHDSHLGALLCAKCHEAGDDGSNRLYCSSCHIGIAEPEGWEAYPTGPYDDGENVAE